MQMAKENLYNNVCPVAECVCVCVRAQYPIIVPMT